jgi:polysaccharide deacetylase 2 family uncharacterized protein YibQ
VVGRFLFGVLSGGVLVAGVFVLGAVLFPIAEPPAASTAAAIDPAPGPEPLPAPVAETPAPDAATAETPEPAPQPTENTAEVEVPEPANEKAAESPSETALADQPNEAPAGTPGVDPAPAVEQPTVEPSPASDAAGTPSDNAAPATAPGSAAEESPAAVVEAAPEAKVAAVAPPQLALLDPDATAKAVQPPAPAAEPVPAAVVEAPPEALPEAPVAEAGSEPAPATEPGAMPVPEPDSARLPGNTSPELPGDAPEGLPEPEVASLPEAAAEDPSDSTFEPAPGLGETEGVIVGRLPRVGDAPEAAADPAAAASPDDPRPLVRFAAPFENPEGKPLLSVVLIDPGTADLDRTALAELPLPVALALDPLDPATPDRAAIYRAGGKEVVMLATGLAEGAQASDIEVAFQEMDRGLPEAVAVMDLALATFQSNRPLASLVVPVVGAQGRGLLTWDQGLNAADQVARRDNIPAAMIFRDFATGGTDRGAIRRLMDRAVFKAGQDGRVVLAGTASAGLVAAILEWTVEGRAATVAIAPVSAVLTAE